MNKQWKHRNIFTFYETSELFQNREVILQYNFNI